MCRAFSCLVTRKGEVIWKAGVDSHDELFEKNKLKYSLKDDIEDPSRNNFARIEIIPDNNEKYTYLFPERGWKLQIDEVVRPDWLKRSHEDNAFRAFEQWKKQVYNFKVEEARAPIHPLKISPPKQITNKHIILLKQWVSVVDSVGNSVWFSVRDSVVDSVGNSVWVSVRDSVRDSVGNSVRDSVVDSVGNSVWVSMSVWVSVRDSVVDSVRDSMWSYIGSLFPIKQRKYLEGIKVKGYPFKSAVKLWRMGLIPSFDGDTWRLHSKDGILFEISRKKLKEYTH